MAALDSLMAARILRECGGMDSDYHALSRDNVDSLIYWADLLKYRKPRNANGSRARYFHAHLTRRARNAWKVAAVAQLRDKKRERKESTHA